MTTIGITGHRGLPPSTAGLIDQALRDALAEYGSDITGVTSLADGADQLFARIVLDQGGLLDVIVPAAGYRDGLPTASHAEYDDLIGQAIRVHRLDFIESTSESHMAASELMISVVIDLRVQDPRAGRGLDSSGIDEQDCQTGLLLFGAVS